MTRDSSVERLLPLVHPDIGFAVQQEAIANPRFGIDELQRILAEDVNPAVAKFIANFATAMLESGSKQSADAAVHAGVVVYRLLESQAEADKLLQR